MTASYGPQARKSTLWVLIVVAGLASWSSLAIGQPQGAATPPSQPALRIQGNQGSAPAGPATADQGSRSSGLFGPITNIFWRRLCVLVFAFLIGFAGAFAYHLGVYVGFIARDAREDLLKHLGPSPDTIRYIRWLFWLVGGVVAAVFQMADADTLVPIQAFVLGASWPAVVTQLMSGRSNPPPPPATVLPPPPTGGAPAGQPPGGAPAPTPPGAPAPTPAGVPPIQVVP